VRRSGTSEGCWAGAHELDAEALLYGAPTERNGRPVYDRARVPLLCCLDRLGEELRMRFYPTDQLHNAVRRCYVRLPT
jgi:hypothetical protein